MCSTITNMKEFLCCFVFYLAVIHGHPLTPTTAKPVPHAPLPSPTTTETTVREKTTPTPAIDPFVTAQVCPNKLDIVLVIDSSGSIQKSWNALIDDAEIFTSNFDICPNHTRVGIIDYSAVANVYISLDSNNTDESVFQALETMRIQPQKGQTWIELGLDRATEVFGSATPVREDVRKVVVMYTDGEHTSGNMRSVEALLEVQRKLKIELFIVMPSKNESSDALQMMASSHMHIFKMNNEPPMGNSELKNAVCWGIDAITPTPTSASPNTTLPTTVKVIVDPPLGGNGSTTTGVPMTSTNPSSSTDNGKCFLPVETGPSKAYVLKFYYNSASKKCEFFSYGGTGGNANNFDTYLKCKEACEKTYEKNNSTTTSPAVVPTTTSPAVVPTTKSSNETRGNTTTRPSIVDSKCELEKEHALWLLSSKIPTMYQVFVPECSEDGKYKQIQHHEGTGYYWCVDIETGDVINGTKTTDEKPNCSTAQENTTSRPMTKCQKERQEKTVLAQQIPDILIPSCSLFDGHYLEIQSSPQTGVKWCVNRFTGKIINGTYVKKDEGNPLCPESSKCETERESKVSENYDNPQKAGQFVPQCRLNGLYTKVQVHGSTGNAWCVDEVTGEEIAGTRTAPGEGMPVCPGEVNPVCLLPKLTGPCRAAVPRYFFNEETATCEKFTYGGCNGNGNNFETYEECQAACGKLTKCQIEREEGGLREPLVSSPVFIPECTEHGLYQRLQRFYNDSTWCVDEKTGKMIAGTRVEFRDADCSNNDANATHAQTKCEGERTKKLASLSMIPDLFIPTCNPKDGMYEEIQENRQSGGKWCVDRKTGETVKGTYVLKGDPKCSDMNATHPQTKCEKEKIKNEGMVAMLPDLFIPACNPNDGLYEEIQENGMTGGKWCVHRETGETVKGSYMQQGDPKCPGTSNESRPMTKCERDVETGTLLAHSIPDYFIPECDPDGLFKEIQKNGMTGGQWCVNKKTGETINGTFHRIEEGIPTCPGGNETASNGTEGHGGNSKNLDGNRNEAVIDLMPYPEPEPEPEPEYLPSPDDFDVYKPKNPCSVELDFGKQRNMAGNMVGGFLPECEENGDYKSMQHYGSAGSKWCVDQKTGHMIEGTLVGPGKPNPNCTLQEAEGGNNSHVQSVPQVLAVEPDKNRTVDPIPVPIPGPSQDIYHPKNPCSIELSYANNAHIMAGGFLPKCDANGDYEKLQIHGSSGYSWCVDKKTGHIINGTMTPPGKQVADCTKEKKQEQIEHTSEPNSGKVVEVADITITNKSIATPQPQLQTTHVLPSVQTKQTEQVDIYKPKNPCAQEEELANKKISSSNLMGSFVGGFVPQCDAKGDYKPMQVHGSTGYKWCVDTKSGHEISGTKVGPGNSDPVCTDAGKAPALEENKTMTSHVLSPTTEESHTKPNQTETDNINVDEARTELQKLAHDCPFEIGTNLTKIGCFNDIQQKPGPLPILLVKDTSINIETPSKNKDWSGFIRAFTCKCAIETRKKGWFTFGIQNYGECYSGPDEGRFDEDGAANSSMCINEDQEACSKDKKDCCAGISKQYKPTQKTRYASYVYTIVTATHKDIVRIEYDRKRRHTHHHQKKRHSKRHLKKIIF